MNMFIYMPLLPEIMLSIMSMVLLMVGVFRKNENSYEIVSNLAIISLLLITAIILSGSISDGVAFGNSLIADSFSQYLKTQILRS